MAAPCEIAGVDEPGAEALSPRAADDLAGLCFPLAGFRGVGLLPAVDLEAAVWGDFLRIVTGASTSRGEPGLGAQA